MTFFMFEMEAVVIMLSMLFLFIFKDCLLVGWFVYLCKELDFL